MITRSARTIIERGPDILLLQRSNSCKQAGQWEFTGGKLEPNESATAGALRELGEETALTVELFTREHVEICDYDYGDKRFRVYGGLAIANSDAQQKLSPEHQDAVWVRPEEAILENNFVLTRATELVMAHLGQLLNMDHAVWREWARNIQPTVS